MHTGKKMENITLTIPEELKKEKKWLKEMKEASIKPFTKQATDFAGRPIPNTEALPSEVTYPYPEMRGNYNAELVLKRKQEEEELEKKKKKEEKLAETKKESEKQNSDFRFCDYPACID